jgi:hypothetical protein
VAAASHFTKAGTRVLINTSPEPVTNWTASIAEDVAVVGGLWAALNYPWLFLVLLVAFVAFAIWVLPKIWRAIKTVVRRLRAWLRGEPAQTPSPQPPKLPASPPADSGPP